MNKNKEEHESIFKNRPLSFEQTASDNGYAKRQSDRGLIGAHIPFFEKYFKRYKSRDVNTLFIGNRSGKLLRSVADYFVNGTTRYICHNWKMDKELRRQALSPEENIVEVGSYIEESDLDLGKALSKEEYKNINLVIDLTTNDCKRSNFLKIFKLLEKGSSYFMFNTGPDWVPFTGTLKREKHEAHELSPDDRILIFEKQ